MNIRKPSRILFVLLATGFVLAGPHSRQWAAPAAGGLLEVSAKKLVFEPTTVGEKSKVMTLAVKNTAREENQFTIAIDGDREQPDYALYTTVIEGETARVVKLALPYRMTLPGGVTKAIAVRFEPGAEGVTKPKLVFSNNGGFTEATVKLKGQGIPCSPPRGPGPRGDGGCGPPTLEVTGPVFPEVLDFGTVATGEEAARQVSVTNWTSRALRATLSAPAPFFAARRVTLPPGESFLEVFFRPGSSDPEEADLLGVLTIRTTGRQPASAQALLVGRRSDAPDLTGTWYHQGSPYSLSGDPQHLAGIGDQPAWTVRFSGQVSLSPSGLWKWEGAWQQTFKVDPYPPETGTFVLTYNPGFDSGPLDDELDGSVRYVRFDGVPLEVAWTFTRRPPD